MQTCVECGDLYTTYVGDYGIFLVVDVIQLDSYQAVVFLRSKHCDIIRLTFFQETHPLIKLTQKLPTMNVTKAK